MIADNPFSNEAATNLEPNEIAEFYSEDFNFSRFINSKKNLFLVGDRGTGKSMTLRYNSVDVQRCRGIDIRKSKIINVYIPCNTTLTQGREHELLSDIEASMVSEHFLASSILFYLAKSLKGYDFITENINTSEFIAALSYKLDVDINLCGGVFESICAFAQHGISRAKKNILLSISKGRPSSIYSDLLTFNDHVLPFMEDLLEIDIMKGCHFSLLIDDAQYLNEYQSRKINTWISHRDHSVFSFKIATTKVDRPSYKTDMSSCIKEGHDFTLIDMESPFQNKTSNFGKLARDIVSKRLASYLGLQHVNPDEYFPENEQFRKDLMAYEAEAQKLAEQKFASDQVKAIRDFKYKYTRALYFKSRSRRSNRPPYSGFETIIQMSTGVVRNLLEPCFWMFDEALSEARADKGFDGCLTSISSSIQTKIILDQSKKSWEWLLYGLDKFDDTCTSDQARHVYNLLDKICILFRERLLDDISEPRAVMFTISEKDFMHYDYVLSVIEIARRSQYIYERMGNAKDDGKSEVYYVPNKILLPTRGLDPVGQHARVSIKASSLYNAAVYDIKIPYVTKSDQNGLSLFDV